VPSEQPSNRPVRTDGTAQASGRLQRLVRMSGVDRLSALYLLVFFCIYFGITKTSTFLTTTTTNLVLSQGVITAVIALAFLVPLIGATYDLSVGAMCSFALVITNYLGEHHVVSPGLGVVVALVACGLVGAVSGFIVVRLRVSSFIATLGVSQVLAAAALLISNNQLIVGAFPQSYLNFGQESVLGLPIVVYYLLVLVLVLWYVLDFTPVGRYLYATGGNADAARLAGIHTDRYVFTSLVASAVIAGVAGVIFSMQQGDFSSDIGPGFLFPAIAAVFFGAVQFSKRPNVWGVIVALYALQFGIQGLELTFSSGIYWITPLFQGASLLIAVSFASRSGLIRIPRWRGGGGGEPESGEEGEAG
jgi:ribose transport system permease protein